jgi:hypothetical protein
MTSVPLTKQLVQALQPLPLDDPHPQKRAVTLSQSHAKSGSRTKTMVCKTPP